MLKKFFFGLLGLILFIGLINIFINAYKNNPTVILRNIKNQIKETQIPNLKTYSDWLWQSGRTFVFDVVYMNILISGTATMHLEEATLAGKSVFILSAELKPSDFFKKIYDGKMVVSDAVAKDTKLSMRYFEESFAAEEKRSKEIIFDHLNNIAIREGIKFKISENINGPVAVFFNFLDHNFNIKEPIILDLLTKEEIYEFNLVHLEVKNNIYKFKGEVSRKDKSSTHGAKLIIWIKDDEVRVPLLIKVVSAVGPTYLRLKAVK